MAKYVKNFLGNYDHFIQYLEKEIINGSLTASLEEKEEFTFPQGKGVVMAFERYSYTGGNRVSLTMTIMGYDNHIHLIATSTGGSTASFFKINTWSEEAFLEKVKTAIDQYIRKQ